jgi:hypothetical protein
VRFNLGIRSCARCNAGTQLGAVGEQNRVAVQVEGIDTPTSTGWSVLVRGEAVEGNPLW